MPRNLQCDSHILNIIIQYNICLYKSFWWGKNKGKKPK